MKKLVSIVLLLVLLLSGCSAKENEEITVVLEWTPNTNHTGMYVALENGYYEDAGLDVSIIQPDGYAETIVASGTAQFGVSAQEYVISARSYGTPVVSIATIIYDNTSGFISKKSAQIESPKDFEGKTYGGWGMDTETQIIKSMVEADGGDFSKVNITTTSLDIFTDINNECDFYWVFEGWQVQQAEVDGLEYNYMPMTKFSDELNFHTPVLITSEEMISEDPETVEAFLSATKKGYEYAIEHPRESADILLKYAPELNEDLVYASQEFLSATYAKGAESWGVQSDEYWTDFYQWLLDREIVTPIDIENAYTNEFIEQ